MNLATPIENVDNTLIKASYHAILNVPLELEELVDRDDFEDWMKLAYKSFIEVEESKGTDFENITKVASLAIMVNKIQCIKSYDTNRAELLLKRANNLIEEIYG